MKRFLDAVNSDKMLTYLELLFENYAKVLLVLGIVSYFMTEYHITAFCIILYGIIILTKRNMSKIIKRYWCRCIKNKTLRNNKLLCRG